MSQEEVWDRFYSTRPRAWRGNAKIPDPLGGEGSALDIGCGNGKTSSTLMDMGYDVTGMDFSGKAVESCIRTFGARGVFVKGDATSLPFPDGSFSYITMVHVLEHLDDGMLASAVSEASRVLMPGGYVFVRCFTKDDMRSASRSEGEIFYRYHTMDSLRAAFSGFETVSAELVEETTRFGTTRSRVECLFLLTSPEQQQY